MAICTKACFDAQVATTSKTSQFFTVGFFMGPKAPVISRGPKKSLHLFSGWNQTTETSFKKKIMFFLKKILVVVVVVAIVVVIIFICSCSSCCCDYSCGSRCCLRRKVPHRSKQAWWSSRPPKGGMCEWKIPWLVVSSQPLWKIWVKLGILPKYRDENKKYLKPPPSTLKSPLKTATVASKNGTFLCFPG